MTIKLWFKQLCSSKYYQQFINKKLIIITDKYWLCMLVWTKMAVGLNESTNSLMEKQKYSGYPCTQSSATLINAEKKMKIKCQRNFSEESQFPSDIHSNKNPLSSCEWPHMTSYFSNFIDSLFVNRPDTQWWLWRVIWFHLWPIQLMSTLSSGCECVFCDQTVICLTVEMIYSMSSSSSSDLGSLVENTCSRLR